MKVLVVEDDRKIKTQIIDDTLASLRYTSDWAQHQEEADALLAANDYGLVLLDLQIPSRLGGKAIAEFGKNLLKQIRTRQGRDRIPVVLMTAQHQGCVDLLTELQEIGLEGSISKPFPTTGRTLAVVIESALEKHRRFRQSLAATTDDVPLKPFNGGVLEYYADRIELCGEVIVSASSRGQDWPILQVLRHRNAKGKYVCYGASALSNQLPTLPTAETVTSAIATLRKRITRVMGDRLGIECQSEDVIRNRHGYHLRDWIVVESRGEAAMPVATTGATAPPPQDGQDGLNHRQRWFRDQLAAGRKVRRRDLEEQFGIGERTAKRDIAALTRAGIILFEQAHGVKCYRLARLS